MIWWFYRLLKDYKLAPSAERAEVLTARFERIFNRARTGYVTLDKLLKRLHANGRELLRVLERREIPLNTNASENDIRTVVTKRKISGGTVSDRGRDARDVMLGLYKTCKKLRISFYQFLGDRLGIPGSKFRPSKPSSIPYPPDRNDPAPGNLPRLRRGGGFRSLASSVKKVGVDADPPRVPAISRRRFASLACRGRRSLDHSLLSGRENCAHLHAIRWAGRGFPPISRYSGRVGAPRRVENRNPGKIRGAPPAKIDTISVCANC